MALPSRQHDGDAGAFLATAGMDCGGEAPPRAAQSLGGVPTVFFSCASGMLMGAHNGRIDQEGARQGTGLRLEVLPEPAPDAHAVWLK
jgi:hypothetical protein